MKTVFIFQTIHGWGKDYTLQGAMEKYEKANGKLKKADKFSVLVFKAKKAEDVGADMRLVRSTDCSASHARANFSS
jgi:hypothetical protein